MIDVGITGLNSNNPFGDGSGVVNFSAQATNATSYGFIVNSGSEVQSIDGVYQYTFNSVEGIENHDIKVIAYSSTNNSINTSSKNKFVPFNYEFGQRSQATYERSVFIDRYS